MKTPILTLSIVLATCLNIFATHSLQITQYLQTAPTFFQFLETNSVSEITLTSDFKSLKKNKEKEVYQPGTISFVDNSGQTFNLEVAIRARGNRRKKICKYPPIKLKLGDSALTQLGLAAEDDYKLVCQCEKGADYEQMLLKEFMAYQIYNIVTENSFKTHLFKLNRVDAKTGKTEIQYAFVLEKMNSLTTRLNANKVKKELIKQQELDRNALLRMCLFQYLIGNTDLGLRTQHNIKMAAKEDLAFAVAYDFDYSGLVDAPYAIPPEILPIENVSERFFMFPGCNYEEINKEVTYLLEKEGEIMGYCNKFDLLTKSTQKRSQRYLTSFFETLKNEKKVRREFIKEN